jgi:hypothetical protein
MALLHRGWRRGQIGHRVRGVTHSKIQYKSRPYRWPGHALKNGVLKKAPEKMPNNSPPNIFHYAASICAIISAARSLICLQIGWRSLLASQASVALVMAWLAQSVASGLCPCRALT